MWCGVIAALGDEMDVSCLLHPELITQRKVFMSICLFSTTVHDSKHVRTVK